MATQSRSVLKNWFKKGLKPLQQQFWDWIDSYWHKDDTIPTASVDGLDAALASLPTQAELDAIADFQPVSVSVSGAATYELSGGKLLEKIAVTPSSSGAFAVGTSVGGSQIFDDTISLGQNLVVSIDYFQSGSVTIYFTGNAIIKLYIR